MSGPNRHIVAGVQESYIGFVNSQGFFIGASTSEPGAGLGSGMIHLLGIQSATPGIVEGEVVNVPGDDTTIGQFAFDADQLPAFIVNTGAFNLNTDALLQGTLVETLNDLKIGVLMPGAPVYPDVCLLLQSFAKSKDTGSDGVKAWQQFIFPVASIQPLDREEFAGRTPGVNRLKVTVQRASRKPWGVTILDATNGTTNAVALKSTSDNPIYFEAFKGNASATTRTLDKTPISVDKIIVHTGTGQKLVPTTDYTVVTATRVLTFLAAPSAVGLYSIVYEYAP